jgi:Uma2 family endonuclease
MGWLPPGQLACTGYWGGIGQLAPRDGERRRGRKACAVAASAKATCYKSAVVTAAPRLHYTHQEYLAFERASDVKHEFVRGLILAMAGGKPEHGARAVRITAALSAQLRGKPCTVFDSDVRLRVRAAAVSAYPDASVVCGKLHTDAEDPDAIVNPLLLVEVLSPSTEEYDRGDKLEAYKLLPSLSEVVFVAHDEARIDVVRRDGDTWTTTSYRTGQTARLESIECRLDVADVFHDPLSGVS